MSKRSLLLLLFGILLSACVTHKEYRVLGDIESFIEDYPDSALARLKTVDTLALRTKRAKAKYSLLLAMALDKCYIDTTNICVIAPAIDYYGQNGDRDNQMKAYYYLGRIQGNRGDYYSAMNAYTTAFDLAEKSEDNDFKCLICAELARVYSRNGNAPRGLYYSQESKKFADLANNGFNSWIMEGRIADGYANNKQWAKADSLFDVFLDRPILDTSIYASFVLSASRIAVRKTPGDADKCIRLYKKAVSLGKRPDVTNLSVLAFAYDKTGQEATADYILSVVMNYLGDTKNSVVDLWRYRIEKQRGHYETALPLFESCIQAQDSLLVASLQESFDRIQKDYFREKSNRISAEKKAQAVKAGILIVIFAMLSVTIFILYRNTKRKWMLDIEAAESLRNDFARLSIEDNNKSVALNQLRQKYNSVFREQFKTLDDLCAAFWSPKKGSKKNLIYAASTRAIEVIRNDALLEETLNNYLEDVMTKLRGDLPQLKDKDFKLIALSIIGFSGKTIASIMNLSVGSVYTYKNRIKQLINNLDSPNKTTYIDLL